MQEAKRWVHLLVLWASLQYVPIECTKYSADALLVIRRLFFWGPKGERQPKAQAFPAANSDLAFEPHLVSNNVCIYW